MKTKTGARPRKSTSRSAGNDGATDSGAFQAQSALVTAAEMYLDFSEKSAPKIKQTVDDLFDFWMKAAKYTFNLEKSMLKSAGVNADFLSDTEDAFQKAATEALRLQRLATTVSTDTSSQVSKFIRNKLKAKK